MSFKIDILPPINQHLSPEPEYQYCGLHSGGPYRTANYDISSTSIAYGCRYGEFSYKGEPIYQGASKDFWGDSPIRPYDPFGKLKPY